MIPCCGNAFEKSLRLECGMVASVFLLYSGGRVGETITNEYTVCIVWKGLIYGISALAVSDQQLIDSIGQNSPVLISAGTVRRSGMDFVADQLFDGRKIRALTIVDNFNGPPWRSPVRRNFRRSVVERGRCSRSYGTFAGPLRGGSQAYSGR